MKRRSSHRSRFSRAHHPCGLLVGGDSPSGLPLISHFSSHKKSTPLLQITKGGERGNIRLQIWAVHPPESSRLGQPANVSKLVFAKAAQLLFMEAAFANEVSEDKRKDRVTEIEFAIDPLARPG